MSSSVRPGRIAKALADPWMFGIFVLVTISMIVFAVLPIVNALIRSGQTEGGFQVAALIALAREPFVWEALRNTMVLGVTSSLAATVVGYVLAFAVTRTGVPGKKIVHAVTLLPIITPPFVLAIAVVLLFGRQGVISKGMLGMDANVYGFGSLVLIQVLAFTPIAYLNIRGMLMATSTSLDDASASRPARCSAPPSFCSTGPSWR